MTIRDFEFSDSQELKLPSFDLTYPVAKSLLVDGQVNAVAYLRITSELGLVFKEGLSRFSRARMLEELMKQMLPTISKFGLKDTQAYIEDQHFAEYLIKRFGFQKDIGIPLYYSIQKENENG